MKNKNNNKNLQGGFAPLLIIAIIAILAIGGGTYVVIKNKESKNTQLEDNLKTEANAEADANANVNANLGINANAKGSLRSMLGLGKSQMCTYTNTAGGVTSSGTFYISTDGSMRGDFTVQTSAGTQTSNMMVKDGTSYVWSGSQGTKMSTLKNDTTTAPDTNTGFDLDGQFGYNCENWSKDESKFTVPAGVQFLDIGAMLKASGGVKLK